MAFIPEVQSVVSEPLFQPTYFNIEYLFLAILKGVQPIIDFVFSPTTWQAIGFFSALASIGCIAIIVYSIIRMREIRFHEKEVINTEIAQAILRDDKMHQAGNPRWHYILSLLEGINESDWRVAIIEGDSMLDEELEKKGWAGNGLGEKLENGTSAGLRSISDAWTAHKVRNQIAHAGSDFSLTQNEARRTIKLFQNVFEELGVL